MNSDDLPIIPLPGDSKFFFSAIKPPPQLDPDEAQRIVVLAREHARRAAEDRDDQAEPAVGERNSRAVSSMSQICASTAVTSRSKWGVLGLIRRPYVMAAFSRVTGSPAIERMRTAFWAIVAAATVSTKCRNSSSVIGPISFDAGSGCTESRDEGKR